MQTENKTIRVQLISHSETVCNEVKTAFGDLSGINLTTVIMSPSRPNAIPHSAVLPNAVLLDIGAGTTEDLEILRALRHDDHLNGIPIIALLDRGTELGPVRAIRAGADDVMLKPIDVDEAREAFNRIGEAPKVGKGTVSALGKVVVFCHVAGGAGATTLAVNTAFTLARTTDNDDVCLIDLDVQLGNVANLLDLSTASRVEDFFVDPHRLDRDMMENLMVRHTSGLRVLTAPRTPVALNAVTPDSILSLIQLAKRRFEFTVIDLPISVTNWTDAVLRIADIIYLVIEPSVPSAFRTRKFFDYLQAQGMARVPIKVVANRYRKSLVRGNDVAATQFGDAIGRPVNYTIPNDYALISTSHGQGQAAVRLKPKSPFAVQLKDMLAEDVGSEFATAEKPRLSFIFGGR